MASVDWHASILAEVLHAYDPGQPRDDQGRWTDGGGSASGGTSLGDFDAQAGTLDGAALVTSQEYRDEDIVQSKIDAGDFEVSVSPEFELEGVRMRVVLDGHHSLSAAVESGNTPEFTELSSRDHDAISWLDRGDPQTFLESVDMGDEYHNAVTGKGVWNARKSRPSGGKTVRVNVRAVANVAAVRKEKRNGRDVVIVPSATMPDNIVMNEIMYPAGEIAKSFASLNRTPAPLGHPTINGKFVSARDPEGINLGWIGAWNENVRQEKGRVLLDKVIDVERANQSEGGKAVLAAIEKGEPVHTSTGLLCVLDAANGDVDYKHSARDIVFDHDAILLDTEGAATPEQGVGMLVNAKGETEEIEVINSFIEDADREMDWAVESLARALERREKATVMERMKAAIMEGLGLSSQRKPSANRKEADMADEKQLNELSAKIDGLPANIAKAISDGIATAVGNAVTSAVKPLVDANEAMVANQKAKDEAEQADLVAKVVKANLLDEETAKATPLNTLRKLAEKATPGKAASLNGATGKEQAGGFKLPGAEKKEG